jgi:AcrR family transcriptional regulator
MADDLPRLQIVEIARSLILKNGANFTMASLCIELGCTRPALRRHFPTKADLVTAVFHGSSAEVATKPETIGKDVKSHSADTGTSEGEWVERRFRIFERAIATLEGDIQAVRQDNTKSIARLEKKLSTAAKSSDEPIYKGSISTKKHDNADAPHIEVERTVLNVMSVTDLEATERAGKPSSYATSYQRASVVSDKPPLINIPRGEKTATVTPLSLNCGTESELQFSIASEDIATEKDGWKELSIFGVIAFWVALAFLGLIVVFTTHAGASYISGGAALDRHSQATKAPSKKADTFGIISPGDRVIVKTTATIAPISLASSLTAKALSLEQFLPNESITINQAGSGDMKAKLKLAVAFAKGDGVKADPMMAVFWSEAAAQQGDADAQYVLGTLYMEGIKSDPAQAIRWFSSAAVGGNRKAMHNLAIALLNGNGVAKDEASSAHWFVRAANLGYRDSAFDLGVLYERGQGVAQNSRIALSWYDKAAAMGDRQAGERAALLRSNGLSALNGD